MINASAFFALWELVKLFVGCDWIQDNVKRQEIGCLFMMFEFPYIAWGVWLLFYHAVPALFLWALMFIQIAVYFKLRTYYSLFGRVNSALSIVILVMFYLGRIK